VRPPASGVPVPGACVRVEDVHINRNVNRVGADGAAFPFGTATQGSLGGMPLNAPIVGGAL
jgi:hypothetical protein